MFEFTICSVFMIFFSLFLLKKFLVTTCILKIKILTVHIKAAYNAHKVCRVLPLENIVVLFRSRS